MGSVDSEFAIGRKIANGSYDEYFIVAIAFNLARAINSAILFLSCKESAISFPLIDAAANYNPDWAVLVEQDGAQRLYFVVETKSSLFTDELRDKESAKIKCGKAYFAALADAATEPTPARYLVARSIGDLLSASGA